METAKLGKLLLASTIGLSSTGLLANESKRTSIIEKEEEVPEGKESIKAFINDLVKNLEDFVITEEARSFQSGTKIK